MDGLLAPRLSIIMACWSNDEQLENTLISVLQNRPADCEILLVHRGSYDDPYDLKNEVRFVEQRPDSTQLDCIAAGVQAARGDVIHLLRCGVQVTDGWTDAVIHHFQDPQVGAVTPLVVDIADPSQVVAAGLNLGALGRRILCGSGATADGPQLGNLRPLGPTSFAAFYRRSAMQLCGGFDGSVGLGWADLDLALSLIATNFQLRLEPSSRVYVSTSTGEVEDSKTTAFTEGRNRERIVWRHAPTIGWLTTLLRHPLLVTVEFIVGKAGPSAMARLCGRAIAFVEVVRYRRHRRRLRLAKLRHGVAPSPRQQPNKRRLDEAHAAANRSNSSADQRVA